MAQDCAKYVYQSISQFKHINTYECMLAYADHPSDAAIPSMDNLARHDHRNCTQGGRLGPPYRRHLGAAPERHRRPRDWPLPGHCPIEKLHNLEALPPHGFTIACVPVKIKAASAGWTRAVAIIES